MSHISLIDTSSTKKVEEIDISRVNIEIDIEPGDVKIDDKIFAPMIDKCELIGSILMTADSINIDYADEVDPVFLCCPTGGIPFATMLTEHITIPEIIITSIKLQSYCGLECTGTVQIQNEIDVDVRGKTVFVVDDLIDTGGSGERIGEYLMSKEAKKIVFVSMLFKEGAYSRHHMERNYKYCTLNTIEYPGIKINDEFVVGKGLDYNGKGRNLQGIYVLKTKNHPDKNDRIKPKSLCNSKYKQRYSTYVNKLLLHDINTL